MNLFSLPAHFIHLAHGLNQLRNGCPHILQLIQRDGTSVPITSRTLYKSSKLTAKISDSLPFIPRMMRLGRPPGHLPEGASHGQKITHEGVLWGK